MSRHRKNEIERARRGPVPAFLRPPFALCLLVALTAAAPAPGQETLYLKGDGHPVASLDGAVPTGGTLPNLDPDRDSFPGLLIEKGGDVNETDPSKYQMWLTSPTGYELDGVYGLLFWSASKDFGADKRGVVRAFLLDCESGGTDCSPIAEARSDVLDWSGGWESWTRYSLDFGPVTYSVPETRSLALKLVVDSDSDDDMWLAYDAEAFPSHLTGKAPSDIVIDCDFGDWSGSPGNEFVLVDEGGFDDWRSPAALDLTSFAVSSNGVSSFHLLTAFDDTSPHSVIAATLIDTGINGNADFALVVRADGGAATVDLYRCDDTEAYGCGAYTLERSYPETSYCLGTAPGPWDADAMIELTLPFHDLGFDGGEVTFTTLVSYAGSSLLASPKDSVHGSGSQDYQAGLYHDTGSGATVSIGPVGNDFYIRRSTDPSVVRAAPPHETVISAPYDDRFGVLGDGETYFYVIEREGGLPVGLSAHKDTMDDTVRLGFDDGDAASAPVDSSFSTLHLDAPVAAADGASAVTVTLVPRDPDGILIGSGCAVEIGSVQLEPAVPAGPIVDNRDGTYTLRIVSAEAGTVSLRVFVEGVELDEQPEILFE